MARLLYQRDSASFMLNAIRRFIRLCHQNPAGAAFILIVQGVANALQSKYDLLLAAIIDRENAYDDVQLADYDLDNVIRNTYDTWKIYTRQHSSDLKVINFFTSGHTEITRIPYVDEPNVADGLATKIESLGNTHSLYPLAAEIRIHTAKVRTGIEAHKERIRLQKAAEAEVEIAKMDAVRGYEVAYLDSRKSLGAEGAERLFPRLAAPDKAETPETSQQQQ